MWPEYQQPNQTSMLCHLTNHRTGQGCVIHVCWVYWTCSLTAILSHTETFSQTFNTNSSVKILMQMNGTILSSIIIIECRREFVRNKSCVLIWFVVYLFLQQLYNIKLFVPQSVFGRQTYQYIDKAQHSTKNFSFLHINSTLILHFPNVSLVVKVFIVYLKIYIAKIYFLLYADCFILWNNRIRPTDINTVYWLS